MAAASEPRIETYIPLYRKYRPQTFADLVGQEAISQTLGNAIRLNKVAHAYLFCGPRGTGKTSSARIFAKSLNCEQGPTVTPCLQCASCVGITQGNALDVVEFDAASNNGVDDARELIENCQYSSMGGRFKVYIIDEVHMLTTSAFNALLKTLEEPPPNVIFVFATTEGHKVLPTIVSRCQRFDFNRITAEDIVSRLRYIAGQEAIAIDDEALLMIARHARGGLRDAVGLLDQVAVLGRAQPGQVIGRKDVSLFIGNLEEELLLRLSAAIAERRAADLLHELTALVNRGVEPIQLVKDLTVHFRNLLLVQASGPSANPDQLALPPDYFEHLVAQSRLFPEVEELPQLIGRLAAVERNLRTSTQPQLWLEVGLVELAYRHEIHLVKTLAERVARLEAQLAGNVPMGTAVASPRPAASASAPASAPPVASPVTPVAPARPVAPSSPKPAPASGSGASAVVGVQPGSASLQAMFAQVCQSVASIPTRALLQQQAFPISHEQDVLTIGCTSEPTLNLLKKPEKLVHLQKAVDKHFGRAIKLELMLARKSDAPAAAMPPEVLPEPTPRPESPLLAPQPESASLAPKPAAMPLGEFTSALESAPAVSVEPESVQKLSESASMPAAASVNAEDEDDDELYVPETDMPPMDWDVEPAPVSLEDAIAAPATDAPASGDSSVLSEPKPVTSVESAGAPQGDVSSECPPALPLEGAAASPEEWSEAKKHALDLLQGKVLD